MSADAPAAATPPASRSRRWWRRAGILIALLVLACVLLHWLLPPARVADLVLGQLGRTLALDISRSGDADYRLRGGPMLLVHDVVVRMPSNAGTDGSPLLRADRVYVALPWRTILSRGNDLAITRIELDQPIIDLPAVQRWLAARPPGESRLPTLSNGLRIRDGVVHDPAWRIEGIAIDLPRFLPGAAVDARHARVNATLRGRYVDAAMRIPFDLALAMTRPSDGAGTAVVGTLSIERDDWRLPAWVTLSGPLQLDGGNVRILPARLGLHATWISGDSRTQFALGLQGPLRREGTTWSLAPLGFVLQGTQILPSLQSRGAIALDRRLVVRLDGQLQDWPEAWPALPPPLSSSATPFGFGLRYADAVDGTGPIGLRLQRDDTRFNGRFRLADINDWINQIERGTPLPPLQGRLETPAIEISGARLEGVVVEFEDGSLDDTDTTP